MAKGKAAYYGPYEQGVGTILRDTGKGFFDYALQVPAIQAKRAAAAAKKEENIYKQIKPGDAWRRFQPSITAGWQDLTAETARSLASGTFSQADLSRKVTELRALENMSTQLQNDVDVVVKGYMGDERVKDSAIEDLTGRIVKSGTITDLQKAAASTIDSDFFLKEQGGSKHINTDAAMNKVMENNFGEWLVNKVQTMDKAKGIGLGLMRADGTLNEEKLRRYTTRDANGNIQIRNIDELREMGISQIFENDPYMNRVLEDRAYANAKLVGREDITQQDKDIALYDLLRGREAGETVYKETAQFPRYAVDFGGKRQGEVREDAEKWLRDFRQGDREALDWISGGTYEGQQIREGSVRFIPVQGPVRPGEELGAGKRLSFEVMIGRDDDKNPIYREVTVGPEALTDEGALKFFNIGAKWRKTRYDEFNYDRLDTLDKPAETLDDL